jgi:hypothetical protein
MLTNVTSLDLYLRGESLDDVQLYKKTLQVVAEPWTGANHPFEKLQKLKYKGDGARKRPNTLLPAMETIELWHPHELALRHMPEDFFVHGPPMPAQSVLCRPVFVEVDDLEPRVITKLVKENLSNLEELIVARCDDAGSEASRKEWRSLVAALKNYSPNLHTLLWTGGLFSNVRLSKSSSLKKLDKLRKLHVDAEVLFSQ